MNTPAPRYVDDATFRIVIHHAPLVSMDIVLVDPEGFVLMGLRTNEPARGLYFVPGGVIRKSEKLADAFVRILFAETGQVASYGKAHLLGVYEHFYETNRFGDSAFGTHYVVMGLQVTLASRPVVVLDNQQREIRWMLPSDVLLSDDVHENTKAYFR